MLNRAPHRAAGQLLAEYLLINLATLLILIFAFDVSLSALKAAPLVYSGDGLDMLKRFKLLFSGEWPLTDIARTQLLGAPFGYDSGDFPQPIAGQLLVQKLCVLVAGDPVLGFNLFVVSSYFLATSAMHWALRRLGIAFAISAALALLFAFQPFHYLRIHHTNYIQYFFIPIVLVFIMAIWDATPPFFRRDPDSQRLRIDYSLRALATLALIVFFSLWNFYYSFFLVALCVTATLAAYARTLKAANLISGLMILGALSIPIGISYIPYAHYSQEHGKNEAVAQRLPQEALLYGLKLSDMLLPTAQHRLDSFSATRVEYENTAPLINETALGPIGLVASIGFLLLLAGLALPVSRKLKQLSVLNIACVMMASVGGLGAVVAYLLFSQIRGYNRISIIIATLSLLAIGLTLNQLVERGRKFKLPLALACGCLLSLGLFDQIPENFNLVPSKYIQATYLSDSLFFAKLEDSIKEENPKVLQLPYICAPECGHIEKMEGYSHLAAYIHSQNIHWSYGSSKGRAGDDWYQRIAKASTAQKLVAALQQSGFSGIYIDRRGYADSARQLETELAQLTQQEPIISPDKTKSFFRLSPTGNDPQIFNDVLGIGFYDWEGPFGRFAWSKQGSELHFTRLSTGKHAYTVNFVLNSLSARTLLIDGPQGPSTYVLRPNQATAVRLEIDQSAEQKPLTFSSVEPVVTPGNGDPRELAFAIGNLSIIEKDTGRDLVKLSREALE